jgi:hypothetical protein
MVVVDVNYFLSPVLVDRDFLLAVKPPFDYFRLLA